MKNLKQLFFFSFNYLLKLNCFNSSLEKQINIFGLKFESMNLIIELPKEPVPPEIKIDLLLKIIFIGFQKF